MPCNPLPTNTATAEISNKLGVFKALDFNVAMSLVRAKLVKKAKSDQYSPVANITNVQAIIDSMSFSFASFINSGFSVPGLKMMRRGFKLIK